MMMMMVRVSEGSETDTSSDAPFKQVRFVDEIECQQVGKNTTSTRRKNAKAAVQEARKRSLASTDSKEMRTLDDEEVASESEDSSDGVHDGEGFPLLDIVDLNQ